MTTTDTSSYTDVTSLGSDDELMIVDLLMNGVTIADHLLTTLARRQWLDAYLLCCGLVQLLDDQSHPDPAGLRRAAAFLRAEPHSMAAAVGSGLDALAAVAGLTGRDLNRRRTGGRRLVGELQRELAELVLGPSDAQPTRSLTGLARRAVLATSDLGPEVARLPSSFRDFDQHPDDLRWLAAAYVTSQGPARQPVAVVGVRTSGCYLAPLLASALRHRGVEVVDVLGVRPGRPFHPVERRALTAIGRAGAAVLVVDDPPGSGSAIAAACRAVVKAGIPADSVTAVFARFAGDQALPALRGLRTVVQPWTNWTIHDRLTATALERGLCQLVGGTVSVIGAPQPLSTDSRGHCAVRFTADVSSGTRSGGRKQFVAEGVGIGYLGRHALAVGASLPDAVPQAYGIVDGVLFRDWLPPATSPVDADGICSYVLARARALPAEHDPTPALRGRDPVWETAAATLAKPFGPLGPVARTLVIEPLTRRLLQTDRPTIVDGDTRPGLWVGPPGGLRKLGFHQRDFTHLEHGCYDQVFDLAGAVAAPGRSQLGSRLRSSYQGRTGISIDPERWLLYRLALLRRAAKAGDLDSEQVGYASAEAVYDYLAECFVAPASDPNGPLCAIDLDGVLETDRLGYPAPSPLGVLAVRSLQAHGFRPVIATGRSLAEAVHRSRALGLTAAVAEYGAAVWVAGQEQDLRTDDEIAAVDRARGRLRSRSGVGLADYRHVIRAFVDRRPLSADLSGLVTDLGLRAVPGEEQTDFVPAAVSKGRGLDAVSAALGGAPWALAVGDSAEDLPMFERAEIGRAPGNAAATVRRAGIQISSARYQAGLAAAVETLLGHAPGRCAACRPQVPAGRTRPLLALLALPEAGDRGVPHRTVGLLAETVRFCSKASDPGGRR